jgi:hypothetical protein
MQLTGEKPMTPSNETVARFVAVFEDGFTMPVTRLILGYGYQNQGGLSHTKLAEVYRVDTSSPISGPPIYAGYFSLEGGDVKVFSGGSMTMKISDKPTLNERLPQDLEALPKMKQTVLTQLALIMAGKVAHTMVAQQ